jgi:serine-type D-Ala-D-Ala carboxypeptidase
VPLWKPADEEMSYADYNFELVGEIVRRVSRMPLHRFARTRIFPPLGMGDTYYCAPDAPSERRVRRATPIPWDLTGETFEAFETGGLYSAASSALSTAQALAIFGQMFLNRGAYGSAGLLSPASVAAMTRNQIPGVRSTFLEEVFPEASWAFGWGVHGSKTNLVARLSSASSFEHSESGGAFFRVDPTNDLVGVYLSATKVMESVAQWMVNYRRDLFMDAVTAAVVEP